MIQIQTILCPVDFSDYSRHALDHAAAIAKWYDSTIAVLHVFSDTPAAAYGPGTPTFQPIALSDQDREQLTQTLKEFVDEAVAPTLSTRLLLREGNVVAEILDQARSLPADLLIMGTHGRSGFQRLVLGSATEKVLRLANVPVLSVPKQVPEAVPAASVVFTRILCAVDFSESSMRALQYAMALAQEANARLTVLHVMQYELDADPDLHESYIAYGRLSVDEFRRATEKHTRARLEQSIPETVRAYCTVETMVASGKPYREILRVAAEQQADLVVLGVQGRGAADLMFFGSTTQHVVRQAPCPVLTLRTE